MRQEQIQRQRRQSKRDGGPSVGAHVAEIARARDAQARRAREEGDEDDE